MRLSRRKLCGATIADAGTSSAAATALAKKKKKKPSMSFGESARYLASSKYIRNLATLVIAYMVAPLLACA